MNSQLFGIIQWNLYANSYTNPLTLRMTCNILQPFVVCDIDVT